MMKDSTLMMAALVLGATSLFAGSPLAAPLGNLEGPREGEIVAGVVNVWGWSTDESPIVRIELGTNHQGYFVDLGYGGTRNDVANAYPEIPRAQNSGYAGALQTRHLPNGPVTLNVRATNADGETSVFQRQIVVANPPDTGTQWDAVDLSGATVRLSGQSIVLDNLSINSLIYDNVDLVFDPYTDSFRIAYFARDLDRDGVPDTQAPATSGPLTTREINDLRFMREEEKMARDVYLYLGERWGHSSFINIAASEQGHMDAVGVLLDRYAIEDPVADDQPGVFVNPVLQALYDDLTVRGNLSLAEALRAGGLIEEVDISDLGMAISFTEAADIIAVYENLSQGSNNHLRAFVGALAQLGITYQAQYLDDATVAEILSSATGAGGQGPGPGSD